MKRDYLSHAFADAGCLELRHLDGHRITSGVFTERDAFSAAVRGLADRGNVYCTLNRPGDLVASNRLGGKALRDEDIRSYVRIPFDFDTERPKGCSSTDDELRLALRRRNQLVAMLSALGWPMPALGASGNGAHALYRWLMPNTEDVRDMLATLYRGLKQDFSGDGVEFDPTVRNPSRIWRLYGTCNRKGIATAERPHRTATIVIPSRWEGVSPRLVDTLASKYARQPTVRPPVTAPRTNVAAGAGDYSTLDIIGWMQAHSMFKRRLGGGKHAVRCPREGEHTTPSHEHSTDTVVWEGEAGRWPTFHCSHSHCEGRQIADVMTLWGDADRYCARQFTRRAA
jgi:hypothetical protein